MAEVSHTPDSDTEPLLELPAIATHEIGDVQGNHVDPDQLRQLLAVASLGAFLGGFAKDMSSADGKASAEAVREAARRLRAHLRERAGESGRIMVDGQGDRRLLVIENIDELT